MFCSSASGDSAIVGFSRVLLTAFCSLGGRVEECIGRTAHSLVAPKNAQRMPNRPGRGPTGPRLFFVTMRSWRGTRTPYSGLRLV